jgi:hypothetical protein
MPRPRRPSVALYIRLSDVAAEALRQQAEAAKLTASDLVEAIVSRYLDRVKDGAKPLHLHARPHELRVRRYNVSPALGERLTRMRDATKLDSQDIGRAAVTEHLKVL